VIKGQTAWVTGASSGIGKALAVALLNKGLNVVASCRKEASLDELVTHFPTQIKPLCFDLSQEQDWEILNEQANALFGSVDFLFLNGGISQRVYAMQTVEKVERHLFQINYFAQVALAKACWKLNKSNNKGLHLAATGSIVSFYGFYQRSTYAATKHALKGYLESMYLEEKAAGLQLCMVYPGKINTPIAYKALTEGGEAFNKHDTTHDTGVSAEKTAAKVLAAIQAKKPRVYIGKKEMLTLLFNRISFGLLLKVLQKQQAEFEQ